MYVNFASVHRIMLKFAALGMRANATAFEVNNQLACLLRSQNGRATWHLLTRNENRTALAKGS